VNGPHADLALAPYLRGELDATERNQVEAHLADCEECRAAATEFQAILERLAATAPHAPEPHWGRYRAELRARLDARARRVRPRWLRPLPVAMAAAAAAAIVLTLTVGERASGPNGDLASLEDAALAGRLDILDKRAIVERLDLLEDLEVIENLDRLAGTREG
jgi:anti-sigma factor RsiW